MLIDTNVREGVCGKSHQSADVAYGRPKVVKSTLKNLPYSMLSKSV